MLRNAGWSKQSLQFLDYLGEYKILPLFLHSQKSPKTHEHHHGWKATTRKCNNQTKNKTKAKAPTPMGTSNGHSPHPAHCHMGRVSIQSKII